MYYMYIYIYIRPMFQTYVSGNITRKYGLKYGTLPYQAILGSRSIPIEEMDIELLAVNIGISTEDQRFLR